MSLDPRYFTTMGLEQYFVDKTTGLPLSNGYIEFYSDTNRSLFKPVFKISGSPPDYTYTELPNPSTLSGVGTFQDESNVNVNIYYFPYDIEGNLELYYIKVFDENGVLQFDRGGFPNIADGSGGGGSGQIGAFNYVTNGQFYLHNNVAAQPFLNQTAGQITQEVTEVAQGGWYFVRPTVTTASDFVTFERIGEFVEEPTQSPRYEIVNKCQVADPSNPNKGFRIRFYDVNKFASSTQLYTVAFSARTIDSGDFPVKLNIIKNFGTGGSPSPVETTFIQEFQITGDQTLFTISFIFGDNVGKNIGTNDDDYVELAFFVPTNFNFGWASTDYAMLIGEVDATQFPVTQSTDFNARSIIPQQAPGYNGEDLDLSARLTREGEYYDRQEVGDIATSLRSSKTGYHLCNGTVLETAAVQSNGVPNSRLQSVLTSGGLNIFPVTGFSASIPLTDIFFRNISPGVVTAPADGTPATGFTFFNIFTGTLTNGVTAFETAGSAQLIFQNNALGAVTASTANTSGFTLTTLRSGVASTLREITQVNTIAATTLAGKHFRFNVPGQGYYVWFTVNGVGVDPAIAGRIGIKVNLRTADTAIEVAYAIASAMNGADAEWISTINASLIPAGSYWSFNNTLGSFYVWYKIDSVGVDPAPLGKKGILVEILSTDLAAAVKTKTSIQINQTYFAVPDYRGMVFKGLDPTGLVDLQSRFSLAPGITGNVPGTFQYDSNLSHTHTYTVVSGVLPQSGADTNCFVTTATANTGASGSSAVNMLNTAVNYFIKY